MRKHLTAIALRWRALSMSILPVSWRFSRIYRNRWWGGRDVESASGRGSSLEATDKVRRGLPGLLKQLKCNKMLDLGCGDFNWMRHVDLDVAYLGGDVVPDVIRENQARYSNERVNFIVLDGIRDPIPDDVDVILCREVLFHLSFRHALALLKNVYRSNANFLIATQIDTGKPNADIHTGGFRPIDLTREPFGFPAPLRCIADNAISENRSLAVWRIADLPLR